METNTTYNLMNQMTQESKSLWRITNVYLKEAATDTERVFWTDLANQKEKTLAVLKEMLRASL